MQNEPLKNIICKTGTDELTDYITDASNYTGKCDAVYFPRSTEEVIAIVNFANDNKIPVTVSAARTSLTGSGVPEKGIVINTSLMNKILDYSKEQKYITLQPGYYLKDLKQFLGDKYLFYPPDPTEELSTIGGNVATNASGAKSFKYGATRNFVTELEIVLTNGDKLNLIRGENFAEANKLTLISDSGKKYGLALKTISMPAVKNASGYYIKDNMDAIDLFIGSEGTLGIITKIKLRLLEARESLLSCLAFFCAEDDALAFIADAREKALRGRNNNDYSVPQARALEFFDENSLSLLREDYPELPQSNAAVWFEQDYSEAIPDSSLEAWNELLCKHNASAESWFAFNGKEREKLEQMRHAVSYKVNEYIKRKGLRKVGTDVAVPDNSFTEFYKLITGLVKASGLRYVTYGHFGNSHIHLNMLPANSDDYDTAKNIYYNICLEAVRLKGTVSAEHGIGKLKKEYLRLMYKPEEIEVMKNIKALLDPHFILGAGNIF